MNVSDAILKRTSIRKWKSTPVARDKIERVLEAGRRAPSWANMQPWRFVVVQDKNRIEALASAAGAQPVIRNAPVIIVCCGSVEDFSRKMQRESLKQLVEVGAFNLTDNFLDNVVLESDLFAPYRLGEQVVTIKTGEQIMIAIAYMTLEAVNQGLGTCWVEAMAPNRAHEVMDLPKNIFVHDLLAVGYPDEDPRPRPRKPLEKIVFWEKFE
jgi:nitroreductase